MKTLIFAALASLAMVAPAQAVTISGTGSVGDLGISSNTPAGETINVGDSFTIAFSFFSIGTGDLSVVPIGTALTVSPFTAAVGQAWSFSSSFGTFVGTITKADRTGTNQNRVVDYFALGTFTPAGILAAYDAGPMSITGSFTQTGGPDSAISSSWSMSSPPAGVPEPGSLALLGLGLVGLGFVRRRKA